MFKGCKRFDITVKISDDMYVNLIGDTFDMENEYGVAFGIVDGRGEMLTKRDAHKVYKFKKEGE